MVSTEQIFVEPSEIIRKGHSECTKERHPAHRRVNDSIAERHSPCRQQMVDLLGLRTHEPIL